MAIDDDRRQTCHFRMMEMLKLIKQGDVQRLDRKGEQIMPQCQGIRSENSRGGEAALESLFAQLSLNSRELAIDEAQNAIYLVEKLIKFDKPYGVNCWSLELHPPECPRSSMATR